MSEFSDLTTPEKLTLLGEPERVTIAGLRRAALANHFQNETGRQFEARKY